MHASFLGKLFFEKYARISASVEIASEFRYASPLLSEENIVIAVSQSGETADTLAALRLAKSMGAYVIGVVNTVGSSVAREADTVLYTWAGPEIAVASTKAYTVQGALLYFLSLSLARMRNTLADAEISRLARLGYEDLPEAISMILAREEEIRKEAEKIKEAKDLFFIGRCADYFGALEASLKLKEISYIHSEAYAAGELKHGTISLIEEGTPVVALSTVKAVEEKLCSNIKEVKARGAEVFSVVSYDATVFDGVADSVFRLPEMEEDIAPIAVAAVLQLYAYHASVARGCPVDQPRNLAKSVTVE
jgi:glucosamine--fructose-6-phosphate aminotransferase (isomerizing)